MHKTFPLYAHAHKHTKRQTHTNRNLGKQKKENYDKQIKQGNEKNTTTYRKTTKREREKKKLGTAKEIEKTNT